MSSPPLAVTRGKVSRRKRWTLRSSIVRLATVAWVVVSMSGCEFGRSWFNISSSSPTPWFGFELLPPKKSTSQMSPLRPNVLPVVSQRGFSRAVAGDIRLTTSDDPVPGIRPVNDRPVNDRRDKPSVRDRHQSAPIVLPPHPTSTSQRYGAEFD